MPRFQSGIRETSGTGLRNRFFFLILATLLLAAVGFNGLTVYFFRSQRLNLIDQQIKASSEQLLRSELFRREIDSAASKIEETITVVLGGSRIGKVFVLRDRNGAIVYESINVAHLQTELPTSPEWIEVMADDQFVRILNSKIGKDKTLQVGLVLDQNFINWTIINQKTLLFFLGLVLAIFALAALLALTLLSPIRLLSAHLTGATSDLKNLKDVDRLPNELMKFTGGGFWTNSDEFSNLIRTVQKLIDRINRNYKLTRMWTLQMAHELKTPLSIIRLETQARSQDLPKDFTGTVKKEIDWISETLTQFLSWAELENTRQNVTLHMLRVGAVVQNAKSRLDIHLPSRIHVELKSDFSVAASPGHLDQLITNVLSNALKFSPAASTVFVVVDQNRLTIKDSGPGIESEVVDRIGEPFNVGNTISNIDSKGTGLGLAWISTVSKLYGWKLEIASSSSGTEISIVFPLL